MAALGGVVQHYVKFPGFDSVPAGMGAVTTAPGTYGFVALFLASGQGSPLHPSALSLRGTIFSGSVCSSACRLDDFWGRGDGTGSVDRGSQQGGRCP